jgi:hypothetical protein
VLRCAEQHDADAILFQVEGDAEHTVRKSQHLTEHRAFDTADAGNAVAD